MSVAVQLERYVCATCVDPESGSPMSKIRITGGYLDSEPVLAYPELGRISTNVSQIIATQLLEEDYHKLE